MRRAGTLAVTALALLESACLVQITRVKDPGPVFRGAREEARRLSGRPGPAQELRVLVWDPKDHDLVQVALPMWFVRTAARHAEDWRCGGDWNRKGDWDWDLDCERVGRIQGRIRGRVRLEDIEKMGLGVVAEVESDDGDQVLVWLR